MKKKYLYFLGFFSLIVIFLGVFFYSTRYSTSKEQSPTITQGIYGNVILYTGNCMPTICSGLDLHCLFFGNTSCKVSFASRAIVVRESATRAAMERTYLKNKTPLVKIIESSDHGFYQLELPPGTYSILVEDEGKEYCNSFGVDGGVCQITLGTEIVEYNIEIDHAAW